MAASLSQSSFFSWTLNPLALCRVPDTRENLLARARMGSRLRNRFIGSSHLFFLSLETTLGPAIFDRDVLPLDIAGFVETSLEGVKSAGFTVRAAEQPDHRHPGLLRAPRAATPPRRRAA